MKNTIKTTPADELKLGAAYKLLAEEINTYMFDVKRTPILGFHVEFATQLKAILPKRIADSLKAMGFNFSFEKTV